ncbi:prolipoprotein diacylglyceryl transferase domain protein [Parvimonas sp. oral taxon 393 str. F0440]|nr:prolipoprotein diacylglyceryl transferase domain protein [Parvimonas sp. oral taxon 393 str. F0440]
MEVKIDRVAFSLFGIDIMWYAIIICFGIMAGLFVATKNSKLRNIKEDEISNLLLFALPISVIGARIYYVVFEWENYKGNFLSMINIREGGLAIYGAVIAAIIVVYFLVNIEKLILEI